MCCIGKPDNGFGGMGGFGEKGSSMEGGDSGMKGEKDSMSDLLEGVSSLLGSESDSSAEASTKSGVESSSISLGEGPININISANASATADSADESSALSVSGDQSTKDMEGMQNDYGAGSADGQNNGVGEEVAEPIDSEIEGMKEDIADGLMAIEELEPGFIDDVMGQVEASANAKSDSGAVDSTQGEEVIQGEEAAQGEEATQSEDAAQDSEGAQAGDAAGGNEDLLAGLEELATMLEELIGQLSGGEAEKPDAGEIGAESDKPSTVGEESASNPDPMEVAEGMVEELGDGEVSEAAQSTPVDTFMEIFDQMSPEAQNEVVGILASGTFGEEGIEAANAVKDDATGDIDASYAIDEAEAA
jgi:hypothetical protein